MYENLFDISERVNNMFKKNSVAFRWLASYMIILIVTVMMSGFLFFALEQDLSDEITVSNDMLLDLIGNELDGNLELQKKIYIQIANLPEMEEITGARKLSREYQAQTAYKIFKQCHSILVSNKSIKEIIIYFNGLDIAVSSFGVADKEVLHNSVFATDYKSSAEQIRQKYNGDFKVAYTDYEDSATELNMVYIHSYPMAVSSEPKATVMVLTDESYFTDKAVELCAGESRISLKDENNETLFTAGNDIMPSDDVIVSEIQSKESPWKCTIETPKSSYWKRVAKFRTVCIGTIIAMLIGGVVLSVYLAFKNYSYIDRLIKKIGEKSNKKIAEGENEYAYLLDTITDVMQEKNSIEGIAENQQRELREHFLARMARGEISYTSKNIEKQLGLNFVSDKFILAIFEPENINALFEEDRDMDTAKRSELASLILRNIIGELTEKVHRIYFFHIGENEIALINIAPGKLYGCADELADVFEDGLSFIEENFNLRFRSSISGVHVEFSSIYECYKDAYETLEYMKLTDITGVGLYKDICTDLGTQYYYPMEMEIQLVNAIRCGEEENAQKIMNEIFTVNFETNMINSRLSRCLMFDILSTILKVSGDIEKLPENIADPEKASVFITGGDTKKAWNYLADTVYELCLAVKRQNDNKKKQNTGMHAELKDNIIDYIKDNYSNTEMTLQGIGEKFEISPYYLSKLFKAETGKSITDYIRSYRVEKATELLLNTNLKLDNIASMVGFFDAKTLNRAFKAAYGITPGKYKDVYKDK